MSETTTAVVKRAGELTWQQQRDLALWAAQSKQYKHIRNPAQAMILMQYGRDMGFGPGQSLQAVYEVNGVPALKAGTIMALVKQVKWRGTQLNKYHYKVLEKSDTRCCLEFYERNDDGKLELVGPAEFTIEDAKRAGLIKPGSGWVKFPRDMLFARAGTAGVRTYAPDCLGGIIPYCTEEMTDTEQDGTPVLPEKTAQDVQDAEWETAAEQPGITEDEFLQIQQAAQEAGLNLGNVIGGLGGDPNDLRGMSRGQYEAAIKLIGSK